MTLTEALLYLETTARVSCPQITCEQAGEIAGLLRDLSDQHQVDIAEMVSWKIHAQVLYERDEALAKLRKAEREWDERGLQAFMRNRSPEEVAGHMKYIADSWGLERKRLIDALCKRGECRHFVCPGKGIEATEDFDADDYAKPGRK